MWSTDEYTKIFTDSYINCSSGEGGFGLYIPELAIRFSSLVNGHVRISSIEVVAIYKGVEMGIDKGINKFLIIAGSMSELQKIFSNNHNNINIITGSINKLIYESRLEHILAFL